MPEDAPEKFDLGDFIFGTDNDPEALGADLERLRSETGRQELMREFTEARWGVFGALKVMWDVVTSAEEGEGFAVLTTTLGVFTREYMAGGSYLKQKPPRFESFDALKAYYESNFTECPEDWESATAMIASITDPGERVAAMAYLAYSGNLDCNTSDGNHCSGWVDSVHMAALGKKVYDVPRPFVSEYHSWEQKGSKETIEFGPGYSVIYMTDQKGPDGIAGPLAGEETADEDDVDFHHILVMDSAQRNPDGTYELWIADQSVTKREPGASTRTFKKIRLHEDRIRVVTKPA